MSGCFSAPVMSRICQYAAGRLSFMDHYPNAYCWDW